MARFRSEDLVVESKPDLTPVTDADRTAEESIRAQLKRTRPRDAVEGEDYTIEGLTGVWKATNDQDRQLVEKAQRGVTDPGYEPGPYALVEDDVESFINWYVRRIRDHLVPHHEHGGNRGRLNAVANQ